jgi:hypothetical protein
MFQMEHEHLKERRHFLTLYGVDLDSYLGFLLIVTNECIAFGEGLEDYEKVLGILYHEVEQEE